MNDIKQKVYEYLDNKSAELTQSSNIAQYEKLLFQEIFQRLDKLELNVRTLENLIDEKQDKE